MTLRNYSARWYYVMGLVLMLLGIGFMLFKDRFSMLLFELAGVLWLGQTLLALFSVWDKEKGWSWGRWLLGLVLAMLLIGAPFLPNRLLVLAIATYQGGLGLFLLIHSAIAFANQLSGRYLTLFDGLIHIAFALGVYLAVQNYLSNLYGLLGLYLVFLSLTSLRDGLEFDYGKRVGAKRRKRVALPIVLTGVMPVSALNKVNQFLNKKQSSPLYLGDRTGEADLEIWVHTARRGFEMMGHVDIVFEGLSFSYGNFDCDSGILFGAIGDGVLITMPVDKYRDSIQSEDWRAVFGYGLVLTPDEKKAIKANLKNLLSDTQPMAVTSPSQLSSYLGNMVTQYGAKAFKFERGQFKTYFVMTTNCVQLADTVVADTGLDVLANHGILTPGAYLNYLDKEFSNPNGRVISKMVLGRQQTKA